MTAANAMHEALLVLRKERDAARREGKWARSAGLTTEIMFARDAIYRATR